jgi:hypothetical protein
MQIQEKTVVVEIGKDLLKSTKIYSHTPAPRWMDTTHQSTNSWKSIINIFILVLKA